jgi:hypothetical protein
MKDGLFLEMTGIPHANQRNRPSPCITYDEQIDICVLLTSAQREPGAATWPPCLGLFNFMVATLAYLRQIARGRISETRLAFPSPLSAAP